METFIIEMLDRNEHFSFLSSISILNIFMSFLLAF